MTTPRVAVGAVITVAVVLIAVAALLLAPTGPAPTGLATTDTPAGTTTDAAEGPGGTTPAPNGAAPRIDALTRDFQATLTDSDHAWLDRAATDGEAVVLAELEAQVDYDPQTSVLCHELVHELGRQAYDRHDDIDTALEPATDWCGGGYVHGVFEGWGRTVPIATIAARAGDVCQVTENLMQLCHHAIGHALMQSDPPITTAAQGCTGVAREYLWSCVEGIVMVDALINTRQCEDHCDATELDPADAPFYGFDLNEFCALVPADIIGDCEFAAGFTWVMTVYDGHGLALGACNALDGGEPAAHRCAFGVGRGVLEFVGFDIDDVAAQCAKGPGELVETCVDGAIETMHQYAQRAGIDDLCATFPDEWADNCRAPDGERRDALTRA